MTQQHTSEDRGQQRILLVIPAYNEQGKIGIVVRKVPRELGLTIIVVDDCSTDETAAEAAVAGAHVIRHECNLGVGGAIRTGIDYALEHHYDVVSVISGDDQHDPSELLGLLSPIILDDYDLVQGSRRLQGLQAPNIPLLRRLLTAIYSITFRLLTGFPCTDATNGGRAFHVRILADQKINLWQDWLNTYELEPYLLFQAIRAGFRVTEAPMKVIYHNNGTTKMKPIRDWWRIFRPMVYLSLGLKS